MCYDWESHQLVLLYTVLRFGGLGVKDYSLCSFLFYFLVCQSNSRFQYIISVWDGSSIVWLVDMVWIGGFVFDVSFVWKRL